ncbi:MAG: undecaprenyl diphosphate synthase family protein, partial [Candidatus Bipolaricaulota bacterium]
DLKMLDPEVFSKFLYTKDIPDPDLIIRTSGEMRLSNFLLWQAAYTELYFTDTLWPDFAPEELLNAIAAYQERNRRFGAVPEGNVV